MRGGTQSGNAALKTNLAICQVGVCMNCGVCTATCEPADELVAFVFLNQGTPTELCPAADR